MTERRPITRQNPDGTLTDGTCAVKPDGIGFNDFRHLDGTPMALGPGAYFNVMLTEDEMRRIDESGGELKATGRSSDPRNN